MKKTILFLTFAILGISLFAQSTWKADPLHSKLTFSVTHLGISDIAGLFKSFDLTITSSKNDFSDASFDLSVDVASINTEVEMRDNHLRSADFFEVEKYPLMTFKSTSLVKVDKDKYKLIGNLSIHGITKSVTMNLWYRGTIVNTQSKATTAGFQLTGTLNRSDFGVGPNFPSSMIDNIINIKADGELIQQ